MVSSDVIAKENLSDFRNELTQIYYDTCCCYMEFLIQNDKEYAKHKWITKDEKYKKSKTKVIGKAIADCVTEENEFAGKTADDIITFDNKPNSAKKYIDPKNYKPEHWNAVILYNYVHEAINRYEGYDDLGDVSLVLEDKLADIQAYYKDTYKMDEKEVMESLNQAVNDIQKYSDALDLGGTLYNCYDNKSLYESYRDINSLVHNAVSNYNINRCQCLTFHDHSGFCATAKPGNGDLRLAYTPTFTCKNGFLYLSGLYVQREWWGQLQGWGESGNGWNKDSQYDKEGFLKFQEFKARGQWIMNRLKELGLDIQVLDKDQWNQFIQDTEEAEAA